jgi:hypothetical protein
VFENRVLRSVSAPKKEKLTGGYTKFHSEELHNLYFSPDVTKFSSRVR